MFILVSGACGFLGFHLCEALLKQKHTVIGIDNMITGSSHNLFLLRKYPHFTFIEQDVCKSLDVLHFVKIDQIYHLASIASPEHYCKFPLETIHVNTIGTENLLKLAEMHSARFLYTSTSEVYGDPTISPQAEIYKGNVNTYGPRACYDESKRLGETIIYEYKKKYNLNTKIVRIFNTYGPNMSLNDKRVIIEFIVNALKNKHLTIFGDGSQTRSFTYVSDTVRGLIQMMNSDEEGPINIGNDKTEYTINHVAEIVLSLVHSSEKENSTDKNYGTIIHVEKMQDDPCIRRPDITLAKNKLNWEPTVSLHEGLEKTIEWVKLNL